MHYHLLSRRGHLHTSYYPTEASATNSAVLQTKMTGRSLQKAVPCTDIVHEAEHVVATMSDRPARS